MNETRKEIYPTNDWMFKRIYGRKGNEKITEKFIEKTSCIKLMEYTLKCCGYKFIITGKSNDFMNCNIYKLVSIE